MNKRNKVKQLNRSADHRKAMIQNMVISLLRHERIESSVAKLKVARSYAERIITRAKRNLDANLANLDEQKKNAAILHNTRYLYSHLGDQEIVNKLLKVCKRESKSFPVNFVVFIVRARVSVFGLF